jgi:hypothetical protein
MAKITLEQINREIMFGGYTLEQLSTIRDAMKFAQAQLGKQIKRTLTVGSTVEFTDKRIGYTYSGKVLKVMVKNVTVATNKGNFRVPASMLTVV